jgi:hypothetical protein
MPAQVGLRVFSAVCICSVVGGSPLRFDGKTVNSTVLVLSVLEGTSLQAELLQFFLISLHNPTFMYIPLFVNQTFYIPPIFT